MTKPERLLLAREAGGARLRQILREQREVSPALTLAQRHFQLELAVEMVLDNVLVASGDENEMFDTGLPRLVHDVLNDRAIDDRKHFLGHGLGGRQEASPQPSNGESGLAYRFHNLAVIIGCIRGLGP